ncbi:MAG: lipid A export permease/ATP-binding protein MsbA [Methylophilaceae bacterium]
MQPISPNQNLANSKQSVEMNPKWLYLRMLAYIKPVWLVFTISIISLIVLSATNTGFLATIKTVTDDGFVNTNPSKAVYLPFLLIGLLALRALAGFTSSYTMRWVGRKVIEQMRLDAFLKLMSLPMRYFDNHSVGSIASKITFDTEQMYNAVTKVTISMVRDSLTIIGMIAYMLYLDWRLTMIFALVAPLMVFFLKRMTPKLRLASQSVQQTMGDMTQVIEESTSGQRMVKIFAGEAYEFDRFSQIAKTNRHMMTRLGKVSGLNSMVIELLAALALGLVVYYAVGRFTAGEFAAFIGALLMLISPIKSLTSLNTDLQIGLAAAQSIFSLIDTPAQHDDGNQNMTRAKGAIALQHVSLHYENNKRPALDNVSLKIMPGEKIALVGKSGGGKTTLLNLLPRFYELQQGIITIDDVDINTMSLKNLRQQFSMVSQEVVLFNGSVFNNIAYGALSQVSEDLVIAAAKAAHAWEFIQQLPNGLQSEIGDRGVRLSGGQRQRLAIARAILKNAPILLLDEATSALDTESEQHVQAALDTLMKNRTTIVIAHRLSTIENADRILVLEQGKIVESGHHQALLALNGSYAKLYQKQLQ